MNDSRTPAESQAISTAFDGISTRLKTAREAVSLNITQAANAIGVPMETWSRYESGRRVPRTIYLPSIARTLNVSIDWLLGCESPSVTQRAIECMTFCHGRTDLSRYAIVPRALLEAIKAVQSYRL